MATKGLPVGLHLNVSHSDYHADPCAVPSLSSSIAKILLEQSEAHARDSHPRLTAGADDGEREVDEDGDDDDTPATSRGTLIHALLLGGGAKFETVMKADAKTGEVTAAADMRTKSAQEHKARIIAEGRIPVIAAKLEKAQRSAARIAECIHIPTMREVTAVWESDGVLCRGRFDWLDESDWTIGDLKTCQNAKGASSGPNVAKYGYHISAAAYLEALETIRHASQGRARMVFAFAEVGRTCGVISKPLDAEFLEIGRRQWARAKALWRACLASGTWPNYRDDGMAISPPPWLMAQDAEQQLAAFPAGGSTNVDF